MVFLILHIVGNAAFALLVKAARAPRFNYPVVGLTNYGTAAVVALATLAVAELPVLDARAALFGIVNGVQYLTTYLLMYVLIGMAGIAVTSSFLRLSVAVPVLASIVIWHEWPTPLQGGGLLLAGAALPLLSGSARRRGDVPAAEAVAVPSEGVAAAVSPAAATGPSGERGERSHAWVAALVGATVLISGCGLLAAKAFAQLGHPEQRPVYVAAVYVAATIMSACAWPWRRRFQGARAPVPGSGFRVSGSDPAQREPRDAKRETHSVLLGVLIGLVNLGQIWVLLPALAQLPGVIAFPVAAAGGLSLAALGGWLFWREPLGGRTGAGILLAVAAAALANAS